MPHYFFDIVDPDGVFVDDLGIKFSSYDEMRISTLRAICTMALENVAKLNLSQYRIIVRDADNREMYAVSLNLIESTSQAA